MKLFLSFFSICLISLTFISISKTFAIGDPAGLTIIEKSTRKLPKLTPTPTSIPVCLEVITYAKNKKTGVCTSFSSSCIPDGWKIVDHCKVKNPNKR